MAQVPTESDPRGCATLEGRRTWGALLGPAWSCARPPAAPAAPPPLSSFALQLQAFASAVRQHELRGPGAATRLAELVDWGGRGRRVGELRSLERAPASWALAATSAESAVANMEALDAIYEASGLGARG